jgi:hypothetical protein
LRIGVKFPRGEIVKRREARKKQNSSKIADL